MDNNDYLFLAEALQFQFRTQLSYHAVASSRFALKSKHMIAFPSRSRVGFPKRIFRLAVTWKYNEQSDTFYFTVNKVRELDNLDDNLLYKEIDDIADGRIRVN